MVHKDDIMILTSKMIYKSASHLSKWPSRLLSGEIDGRRDETENTGIKSPLSFSSEVFLFFTMITCPCVGDPTPSPFLSFFSLKSLKNIHSGHLHFRCRSDLLSLQVYSNPSSFLLVTQTFTYLRYRD